MSAALTIHRQAGGGRVHLTASNGEPLMHSKTLVNPGLGRIEIIRAMIEMIEGEGFTVINERAGCAHIETAQP